VAISCSSWVTGHCPGGGLVFVPAVIYRADDWAKSFRLVLDAFDLKIAAVSGGRGAAPLGHLSQVNDQLALVGFMGHR
jgi:hypothetical protein